MIFQHIAGKRHRRFADNDGNFAVLDDIFRRLAPHSSDNFASESDLMDDDDDDDDGLEIVGEPADAQFFNEHFRRGLRRRSQEHYQPEPVQKFAMPLQMESTFPSRSTALSFMKTDLDMDDPFIVH